MNIVVELPATLSRFAEDRRRFEIPAAATVAAALDDLANRYPKLQPRLFSQNGQVFRFIGIFVNDEDVRQCGHADVPVKPGDVITLVSAVAGG